MTKNGIKVKMEHKQKLLACLAYQGIKVKACKTSSKEYYCCTVYFNHFQQLFQAGFYFCKVTGHSPKIN